MARWAVVAAMGLVLAAVLSLVVRWLWRQRGRPASTLGKALIVSVCVIGVLLSWLLVGGLQSLWLERRNQPVTVEDLRILERADAFLEDESSWNRRDDRQCDDDEATGRWSLSCALDVACIEELGHYEHARVALQEVRFVVEEVTHGRQFEGRLMGFNNLPETRFEDVKNVLRVSRERVQMRLERSGHAALQEDEAASSVIQSYRQGLRGIHAGPEVGLTLGKDPALGDDPVLLVDYQAPGPNPAGRDVWCDAENTDWSGGEAISFEVKVAHALRLSVSFVDRNGVAYTAWTEVPEGRWHSVRLPFSEIRPNPYFQPPSAKRGAPLDVSEVRRLGFAPQDDGPGQLAVSQIVLER